MSTKEDIKLIKKNGFKAFKPERHSYTDENGQTRVILADEISPDTCRLWDVMTNKKLDKDRFRRDLGDVEAAYIEIANRLGVLPEGFGK